MDKLVVIGVDTSIGAGLAQALKAHCDVSAIAFSPIVEVEEFPTQSIRRGDCHALTTAIEEAAPDWLICAGSLAPSCWDLPALSAAWQLEPSMTDSVAQVARKLNARLIALSSDVVFAGPKMFHDEAAPTTSTHPAAQIAVQCEEMLVAAGAMVARTHAYAWAPAGAEPGLVERIVHALRVGQKPPADGQRFATPIFAADLAPLLHRAAERNLTGLYHLSAAERTSSFRLASQLAAMLGAQLQRDKTAPQRRPADSGWLVETSLDSRRARRALGMPLPMLAEGLERFVEAEPGLRRCASLPAPIEQAA